MTNCWYGTLRCVCVLQKQFGGKLWKFGNGLGQPKIQPDSANTVEQMSKEVEAVSIHLLTDYTKTLDTTLELPRTQLMAGGNIWLVKFVNDTTHQVDVH